MRLFSLRLIVALIVGVTLVSVASAWYEVREAKDNLRMDLEHKVATFGESLVVTSEAHLQAGDRATLERILRPLSHRDHLLGVGIYDREDFPLIAPVELYGLEAAKLPALTEAMTQNRAQTVYVRSHFHRMYAFAAPLHAANGAVAGGMVLVYDTG